MSGPLTVNTRDGACWTRREATRGGEALYAPEKCGVCPAFVMVTLTELAELGIVGTADVLPMPVGPETQELSADRLAEIRSLDLLALMDDRVAPVISAHLAVLLAEIDRLRDQRDRRRARLVALDADALNVRGALSPNGEDRKVPFPLGPTLLPAVEWLIARVAELEAERHTTNEALDDAVQALRARPSCPCPPADQPGPHQLGCPLAEVPRASVAESAPRCRCDEPGADPYACEADDCTGEFSELNPFASSAGPVHGHDAKVSRPCDRCEFRTTVWHVDDGSAEEELHRHVVRVHGGGA